MVRQVTCECGFIARDETDDAVIAKTEAHIATDHPGLAGSVSRDDIAGWIELVPD